MPWAVREERPGDAPAIAGLTEAAFRDAPHADGTERTIAARLRASGELALSLVAETDGALVGHAAFSPVAISDGTPGWYGLGPVSVAPAWQRRGIGSALIRAGLARLRVRNAGGCVVLGDPAFYRRLGFGHDPRLVYPGPPAVYFQRLVFDGAEPQGVVSYSPAFG